MDTAAGILLYITQGMSRLGAPLLILALALALAAFIGTLLIVDLVQPAAEPVVAAPFRWNR